MFTSNTETSAFCKSRNSRTDVRYARWQAQQDFNAGESDEGNGPSLKTRRPFRGRIRPAVAGCTFRILVFLNSTTAQKSYSLQLTELQTVYILPENVLSFCSFTGCIIYALQSKRLQNKLNWSRKVTRTAVASVAAAGSGSYLFVPEWWCVFSLINHPNIKTRALDVLWRIPNYEEKSGKYSRAAALRCYDKTVFVLLVWQIRRLQQATAFCFTSTVTDGKVKK